MLAEGTAESRRAQPLAATLLHKAADCALYLPAMIGAFTGWKGVIFTIFGGSILNKEYFCIPPKSRILFFEPDTPKELYIRYKPAPYQKVNQQTCDPKEVEVKGPKTRGRQVSIKEVSSITSSPTRGWDKDAPTNKLTFT